MKRFTVLLQKKFSQPRFKEVALFSKIKEAGETFFTQKNLSARIISFDGKTQTLTIKVLHSSEAREIIGNQLALGALFKKRGLPIAKKIQCIL